MKTGEIEKIASRMPKTASRAINNIGKILTKPLSAHRFHLNSVYTLGYLHRSKFSF
jgi:hypothetical protein